MVILTIAHGPRPPAQLRIQAAHALSEEWSTVQSVRVQFWSHRLMSTWIAAWKVTKPNSDLEESGMEWVPCHLLAYGGEGLWVTV